MCHGVHDQSMVTILRGGFFLKNEILVLDFFVLEFIYFGFVNWYWDT
jgi:hypothetical protein